MSIYSIFEINSEFLDFFALHLFFTYHLYFQFLSHILYQIFNRISLIYFSYLFQNTGLWKPSICNVNWIFFYINIQMLSRYIKDEWKFLFLMRGTMIKKAEEVLSENTLLTQMQKFLKTLQHFSSWKTYINLPQHFDTKVHSQGITCQKCFKTGNLSFHLIVFCITEGGAWWRLRQWAHSKLPLPFLAFCYAPHSALWEPSRDIACSCKNSELCRIGSRETYGSS